MDGQIDRKREKAFPLAMGDVKSDDALQRLDEWTTGIVGVLKNLAAGNGLGDGVPGSGDVVESDEEDISDAEDGDESDSQKPKKIKKKDNSAVLEDLGKPATGETLAIDFTNFGKK